MKVESYDPYHIGIKLSNINLPIFREKVIKTMKSLDLHIIAKDEIPVNVPTEILAKDEETKIEINYTSTAINTIGNNPQQTNQLFSKLLKILTTIGYELDALVGFYEIATNINIKSDKDPRELVNTSVNCDLSSWNDIGSDLKADGIKFDYVDKETAKDSLSITVGPNPVRPKNYLLVNIRYQHIEDDKIIDFGSKIEDRVLSLVGSLGEKNV